MVDRIRKPRINPVEIVILMTVLLVLCNSVYNLFYDTQGLRPIALKEMNASPVSSQQTDRAPAAFVSSFGNTKIGCDAKIEKDTSAAKIRLSGPLCSPKPATTASILERATVQNGTNGFVATVFTDPNTAQFSTDYIPLAAGKNEIKVEFSLKSGSIISQEIDITRL